MKKFISIFFIILIVFFSFPFSVSAAQLDFSGDVDYWSNFVATRCVRGSVTDYPTDCVIFRDSQGYYWFIAKRGDSNGSWGVTANASNVNDISSLKFQVYDGSSFVSFWCFKSLSNTTTDRPAMSDVTSFPSVSDYNKTVSTIIFNSNIYDNNGNVVIPSYIPDWFEHSFPDNIDGNLLTFTNLIYQSILRIESYLNDLKSIAQSIFNSISSVNNSIINYVLDIRNALIKLAPNGSISDTIYEHFHDFYVSFTNLFAGMINNPDTGYYNTWSDWIELIFYNEEDGIITLLLDFPNQLHDMLYELYHELDNEINPLSEDNKATFDNSVTNFYDNTFVGSVKDFSNTGNELINSISTLNPNSHIYVNTLSTSFFGIEIPSKTIDIDMSWYGRYRTQIFSIMRAFIYLAYLIILIKALPSILGGVSPYFESKQDMVTHEINARADTGEIISMSEVHRQSNIITRYKE